MYVRAERKNKYYCRQNETTWFSFMITYVAFIVQMIW